MEIRRNWINGRGVEVEYQDLNLEKHNLRASGDYLAHCLQHEIDHLNGILYIDYLSKIKKDSLIKKLLKLKKGK